jgi:hypothetical protein
LKKYDARNPPRHTTTTASPPSLLVDGEFPST